MNQDHIDRLRAVQAIVNEHPYAVEMAAYFVVTPSGLADRNAWHPDHEPHCGTVACIAGWLVAIEAGVLNATEDERTEMDAFMSDGVDVHDEAAKLIGDAEYNAHPLFFETSWPDDLYDAYRHADSVAEHSALVSQAIDRWIEARKAA